MMFAVEVFQALTSDMRIDLRRRQVAVAQQQLHDAQVCASIQQVRGKRMPQAVRRQFLADPGFFSIALDDVPERLARHAVAPARREQVVGLALKENLHARAVDKIANPALRLLAKGYQALAIALADDARMRKKQQFSGIAPVLKPGCLTSACG